MPLFSRQFIDQVAQATDLVELVSQYVTLKKKGREFVGLCPFHDDKNPSMNVSAAKQIFKCFACGAGGGVFQWMMMYEKLSFPEAVRTLADRSNIPLPEESARPAARGELTRRDLYPVMNFAVDFYRRQLHMPAGRKALEYARSRQLSDESLDRFAVGYAPESWDALLTAAGRQGIGQRALLAAGLVTERKSGGCYDRFRNRLILPIYDRMNRAIALGGRAMSDEQQAKYLNSPDTPLFDKSGELYALNWAREAIAKSDQAVVVEGYFDALIPLQAGVDNVVATLGTSLTDRHVRMLSHYAREVVLVFDADVAGAAAAERALEIFLQQQLQVRVATIPAGKDPCDYCLAEGADALRTLLAEAPDALEYAWSRRQRALQQAGGNLADRRQVVEDFLRLIASSSAYGAIDEVRRGQLAQHIGQLLNIGPADLQREMKRLVRKVPTRSARGGLQGPGGGQYASDLSAMAERQVLEVLLAESELFDHAAERIGPEDFQHPEYRMLAGPVWARGMEGTLSVEEMLADEGLAEAGAMLTELAISGQRRGNYQATLDGAVECILFRRHRQETEKLKEGGLDDEMTLRRIHQNAKGPSPRRFPRFS